MLSFLRKHQRFFLIVVTSVIVVSFMFFGTFSNIADNRKGEDKTIATAIDGSKIKQSQLEKMIHFLSYSGLTSPEKNLFNDGVVEKDFLESELGNMVSDSYFSVLEPSLQRIFQKAKEHRHYVHSSAPFLQEELVWQSFCPDLYSDLQTLRASSFSKDSFSILSRLYLAQGEFPAERVQRVIQYQQNQYSWLPQDPSLQNHRFGLFGFTSIQDWFGRSWMQLVAEVIINGAKEAEARGYKVTDQEAKVDLVGNLLKNVKLLDSKAQFDLTEAYRYFPKECQRLGFTENDAVSIWKNILLFRRFLEDASSYIQVDPFMYDSIAEYSQTKMKLETYRLPKDLQFQDFRTLLKWEIYLDATAKRPSLLQLPTSVLSLEEIEKKNPELIETRYELDIASTHISKFFSKVSLKQLWDWQVEEENWNKVASQFPEAGFTALDTSEGRFTFLENLEPNLRAKVDRFCLEQIICSHPEWMEEELNREGSSKKSFSLTTQNSTPDLVGIHSFDEFRTLLESAPLETQNELSMNEVQVQEKLKFYSQDNQNFYRICVIDKKGKNILSFSDALKDRTLDQMLDRVLEVHYTSWMKKAKPEDGKKGLHDVKDQVGASYYKTLLDAIRSDYVQQTGLEVNEPSLDFYAKNRFFSFMQEVKKELKDSSKSKWTSNEVNLPWKVENRIEEIARSDDPSVQKDLSFSLSKGDWSSVYVDPMSGATFFKVDDITTSKEESFEKMQEARSLLLKEAKQYQMKGFLEKLSKKGTLVVYGEESL